jgi:TatD DNase family protein
MNFIDTHTHLYLDAFDADRDLVITAAIERGVGFMLLPNIDSTSVGPMMSVCKAFPETCFPMMGLHPTSVKANYADELAHVETLLSPERFIAVGEIGIDLYWDRTYEREQEEVFRKQIELALKYALPVVIHSRNSTDRIIDILNDIGNPLLRGVFHCFSGSPDQAHQIIEMGFYLGIGGVLTYPKSGLAGVVLQTGLKHLLLETDAPFLAPVPYRGKRNESAYVVLVAQHLAELLKTDIKTVAEITTANAVDLFNLKNS